MGVLCIILYNISTASHTNRWRALRDCKEFSMLKRHPYNSCQNYPKLIYFSLVFHRFSLYKSSTRFPFKAPTLWKACPNQAQVLFSGNCMLRGLCLGAMRNAWMKHAMTSSWVIAPAPVACMTFFTRKVNDGKRLGPSWNCWHANAYPIIFCDTMWNFYRLHTRPHSALNGFRQPQPTKQQTNHHESQHLSRWPLNSITVKPQQVPNAECRGKLRGKKQEYIREL